MCRLLMEILKEIPSKTKPIMIIALKLSKRTSQIYKGFTKNTSIKTKTSNRRISKTNMTNKTILKKPGNNPIIP